MHVGCWPSGEIPPGFVQLTSVVSEDIAADAVVAKVENIANPSKAPVTTAASVTLDVFISNDICVTRLLLPKVV